MPRQRKNPPPQKRNSREKRNVQRIGEKSASVRGLYFWATVGQVVGYV